MLESGEEDGGGKEGNEGEGVWGGTKGDVVGESEGGASVVRGGVPLEGG